MRKTEIVNDIRAFNAAEFGFLGPEILRDILTAVMGSQTRFSTPDDRQFFLETVIDKTFPGVSPNARDMIPFRANKKLIADYFLGQLLEKHISGNALSEHTADPYRAALRAEQALDQIKFKIMPVEGQSYFKVRVPFVASFDPSSPSKFQASSGKSKLITEGSGNYFLLVSKADLEEIYASLRAHIESQAARFGMAVFVSDLRPKVETKKEELRVDRHPYAAIYEGRKGVAYQGEGLGGFFYSVVTSFFEAKPKNNLEKVIRLLRNYQNQIKVLTHTHTDEVGDLITHLQELASQYQSMSPGAVDLMIIGRLQTKFETWSEAMQKGSAMRRVVFAMNEIIPGVSARLVVPSGSASTAPATSLGSSLRVRVDTIEDTIKEKNPALCGAGEASEPNPFSSIKY